MAKKKRTQRVRDQYARYQRESRRRMRKAGLVQFCAWVHPEDRERLRILARNMTDQRMEGGDHA